MEPKIIIAHKTQRVDGVIETKEICDYESKHYFKSPNGKIWEIKVNDAGILITEDTGEVTTGENV